MKKPSLDCSIERLTSGDLMTRFVEKEARVMLLEFLVGHMKSAKLMASRRMKRESHERFEKRKVWILEGKINFSVKKSNF